MSISKRDQLVRAAWKVIAERGVDGMRVEDVTAAVNVSNSLAYYHFETRAKLLAATIDYNEGLAPSPTHTTALGNALERLEAVLLADLTNAKKIRDNNIVWNELNSAATFDPEVRVRVVQTTTQWIEDVEVTIRQGLEDGSIRQDVDPAEEAELLTALLAGLITRDLSVTTPRSRGRQLLRRFIREHLAPRDG